jgi:hypothetical protein
VEDLIKNRFGSADNINQLSESYYLIYSSIQTKNSIMKRESLTEEKIRLKQYVSLRSKGRHNYHDVEERVEISLIGLTPPHCCACSKPEPNFQLVFIWYVGA